MLTKLMSSSKVHLMCLSLCTGQDKTDECCVNTEVKHLPEERKKISWLERQFSHKNDLCVCSFSVWADVTWTTLIYILFLYVFAFKWVIAFSFVPFSTILPILSLSSWGCQLFFSPPPICTHVIMRFSLMFHTLPLPPTHSRKTSSSGCRMASKFSWLLWLEVPNSTGNKAPSYCQGFELGAPLGNVSGSVCVLSLIPLL